MEEGPAVIRRAHRGEGPELTELALRSKRHWGYDEAFMADVREELTFREAKFLPDFHVYVLERAGRRLGFCSLLPVDARTVELDDLWVEPGEIGHGHGKALFDHAARVASDLGYRTLRIVADPFAEAFYKKRGAVRVALRESSVRPGRTLPVLEYPLHPGGGARGDRRGEGVKDLLQDAARRSIRYLEGLEERRVTPAPEALGRLAELGGPLPESPRDPGAVLDLLDRVGSPATVASASGRFFGFVVGGSLPASLAANWLAGAWDQDAGMWTLSPAAAAIEEVARQWLVDLFGLPRETAAGFVTGATMANFTGLAAARHSLLAREGWNVTEQGLFGAPPIDVVVGEEVHVSVLKALSLLGLGRERVIRVPTDGKGRMRPEAVPPLRRPTILCLQAGNVNTGAFDPAETLCPMAREAQAWVHVDGAFGLWGKVAPQRAHLLQGYEQADSLATDCHKWLNVPYDSGIAFVTSPEALRAAMSVVGAVYLQLGAGRDPSDFTPELSRRSRGVEVWAALLSLGRFGLRDLVEGTCRHATRFAEGLQALGWTLLNDVVLNQVLVARESDEETRKAVAAIQAEGTCFCSGTLWKGRAAMRVSVSSWATTDQDVERSLGAIRRFSPRA